MRTNPTVKPYISHPRATEVPRPEFDKFRPLPAAQPSISTPPEQLHRATEESEPHNLGAFWSELDQWRLLGSLHEGYLSLNQRVGRPILRERTFVQPKEMRCTYSFQASELNYEMALTIRMSGVTLIFSSQRQGRHGIWLKFPGLDPHLGESYSWKIADELKFATPTVNNNDFKMWFFYLISRFRNSLKPGRKIAEYP